jgi:hypothetical protein
MQYPQSMDELLKDGRTSQGKRYPRQNHKEPFTGEDFAEIRAPSPTGSLTFTARVGKNRSSWANFVEQYKDFEGEKIYNDGQFVYVPPQGQIPRGWLTILAQQPLVSPTEARRFPRQEGFIDQDSCHGKHVR